MPALGMAQEKGTLVRWLKAEGESITKGEPLMEVETDKATVEVEAPASGILASVTAAPGDEVPVGQRIAVILAQGTFEEPTCLVRFFSHATHACPKTLQLGDSVCADCRAHRRLAGGEENCQRERNRYDEPQGQRP